MSDNHTKSNIPQPARPNWNGMLHDGSLKMAQVQKETLRTLNYEAERNARQLVAAGRTAEATEDIQDNLTTVIENQNKLIDIQSRQLDLLHDLFVSQEDGVAVSKENRALVEAVLSKVSEPEEATKALLDPNVQIELDKEHSTAAEIRYKALGFSGTLNLTVIFTVPDESNEVIRIISAWKN